MGVGKKIWVAALLLLCFASIARADMASLKPSGFVNDFARVIDSDPALRLSNLLTSFNAATGIKIAVVTVPSLDDITVEDYATRLFETWGIGKKGEDNGLLILVAPNERKMRIEVGYGLEKALNDAAAGRTIRDTMIPFFKEGDFSGGIIAGAISSIDLLSSRLNLNFDPASAIKGSGLNYKEPPEAEGSLFGKLIKLFIIILIVLFFIKNPFAALFFMGIGGHSHRSSSGWSSGGSFGGGGFGGFGGGMSGGGGASGSW